MNPLASKTVVRLVCDNERVHGTTVVDGETTPPIGKPPRVIELCASCRRTVTVDELLALVRLYGRNPATSKLPPGAIIAEPPEVVPPVRRRKRKATAKTAAKRATKAAAKSA